MAAEKNQRERGEASHREGQSGNQDRSPCRSQDEPFPKNYSRGEGQKAVTQAYKDNWDAIFKKKKR